MLRCPDCKNDLLEFDLGSGIHHCINPHCKFQYFDKNTGKKEHKKKIKQLLAEGYDKVKNRLADFDIVIAEFVKFHVNLREIKTREDDILENALEYSERLGKEKGISFVLMIDEFQELLKWGDEFLKMFRRLVQSQSHVAYVFSGSAPTIMKEMVYDAKSPFYKQLVEVPVGPLPEKQVTSFVKSRLGSVKISVPDGTLGLIYYLTKGLPDYVQRLGLQIYMNCLQEDTKTIKDSDVHKAYEEMLVQLDPDFSSLFATFSDLEKEILIALANGNASPATICCRHKKTPYHTAKDPDKTCQPGYGRKAAGRKIPNSGCHILRLGCQKACFVKCLGICNFAYVCRFAYGTNGANMMFYWVSTEPFSIVF